MSKQSVQRRLQLGALLARSAAERGETLLLELEHDFAPGGDALDSLLRDRQLPGARVGWVRASDYQTLALQGSDELRDVHRFKAADIRELALARLASRL